MASTPALYMCFRCYQLFDSLDDVLFHQYNLHPNDVGDEGSLASAPGPQAELDEVFQCVPCWVLFQSQEELDSHLQSGGCSQHQPIPGSAAATQPPPASSASNQQDLPQSGPSPAGTGQNCSEDQDPEQPGQSGQGSSSQIQFQCGDCGCLFESLAPWLQHRKLGECRASAPEPELEPAGEVPIQGAEPGEEPGTTEGGGAESKGEPADLESAQDGDRDGDGEDEGDRDGDENGDGGPQKAGGRRKKSAASIAATSCRSFLCGECGAGFNWQPALVAHRRTEHGLEGALHHCLDCGESFMNTALFVQHCKKHRDWLARKPRVRRKRSLQQTVENGGREKEIIRKRPAQRRLKARALSPSSALEPGADGAAPALPRRRRRGRGVPLECPQCRRTFSNPRYLHAHVLSHSGQKQFRCEVCDKAFTYQNNLRRHRLLHTGDRPYMCDRCGKTFTQSSHLKDHLRNHDRALGWAHPRGRGAREQEWADVGPKLPHPCPDCPRSFMTQTQLLMHRKMCPICERSFKWRGSLPAHIVRHTDNKLFACDVCGKTFSYQTNLARHLIIHAGTRPYACRHCGKTFNQSSNLRQHLLVHAKAGQREEGGEGGVGVEGEAQLLYPCSECPISFTSFSLLQKHRLTHPGQQSFPCPGCGLEPCACQQPEEQQYSEQQYSEQQHGDQPSDDQPRDQHDDLQADEQPPAPLQDTECLSERTPSCAGGRGRRGRGRRRRGSRQAQCDLCGRCCGSAQELELHRLSHAGQAQLQCPLDPCQRRFTTSNALQNHLFSHFPGPTCQNPRPEGLLDPTVPQPAEETEVETTVAVLPLWEVFPSDPAPAGP